MVLSDFAISDGEGFTVPAPPCSKNETFKIRNPTKKIVCLLVPESILEGFGLFYVQYDAPLRFFQLFLQ